MSNREYPERPLVGVGGVVIDGDRALLVRRGTEPLRGEWSIPGGLLECGETLMEGVAREMHEETGLTVRVVELIEALERIFPGVPGGGPGAPLDVLTGATPDGAATGAVSAAQTSRGGASAKPGVSGSRPRYHYVILDYLCEIVSGDPRAGGDATDVTFAREEELHRYSLSPVTLRVLSKAFALARASGRF